MYWHKLGKIFDLDQHNHSRPNLRFAKSPQAIQINNIIRIYFCTATVDPNNVKQKVSRVYYVDFSRRFEKIIGISDNPVLLDGELGTFDEHGVFPFSPFKLENRIMAYTTGWSRRKSVSVETSIGLVESFDGGNSFQRIGKGPILTSSLHEPFLVCDGYVAKFNDIFHMWYLFGKNWVEYDGSNDPERVYKIGHATSVDGLNWVKEENKSIISDNIGDDECQALPCVFEYEKFYYMVFCYRHSYDFRFSLNRGYKLGCAYSRDLKEWHRDDSLISLNNRAEDWDSFMQCYPSVLKIEGKVYLLYNGNNFGESGFGLAELIAI